MSTKRLAIRGVVVNWLGRGCGFIIAFVVTPILVRGLGDETYGIWAVVISLTSYYGIVDLGLRAAAVKYIAQYDAVQDQASVNKVVATMLGLSSLLSLLALLVAGAVALAFPWMFSLQEADAPGIRLVVLLTGFNVAQQIVGQVFGAALAAAKRFDLLQFMNVSAQVLQACLLVGTVAAGGSLLTMTLLTNAVTMLREASQYTVARRVLRRMTVSPRCFDRQMVPMLVRFGGLNLAYGCARRGTETAGSLIVGLLLGPAAVTFYSIAEALTRKANELNKGIHGVVVAVSSQLDAEQRRDDLARTFLVVSRGLLAVALTLAIMLIALGRPLVGFWIGPEYAAVTYALLCFLALAMVPSIPATSPLAVLTGMNHMKAVAIVGGIEFVTLVVGGVVLVPVFGLAGMAVAVLVAQFATEGVLFPVLGCAAVGMPLRHYLRRGVVPAAIAAMPALAVGLILRRFAPPAGLWHVLLEMSAIGMAGLIGTFFFCLGKRLRMDVLTSMLASRPLVVK